MECMRPPIWRLSLGRSATAIMALAPMGWSGYFPPRTRIFVPACSMLTAVRRRSPATAHVAWLPIFVWKVTARTGAGIKTCTLVAHTDLLFEFEAAMGEPQIGDEFSIRVAFGEVRGI